MIKPSNKLVQITNPIRPDISLETESGRKALAAQMKADMDEYAQKAYDDGPRSHLGASEIGHPCSRYLWYKFRWCFQEEFSGRMQRLFNRGHREEERFIEWLRGIGCEVKETDNDGNQFRVVAVANHFGGSCDGMASLSRYSIAEPVLVEFKTHSDKSFQKLKAGVRTAKPQHWSQMAVYGFGFGIRYAVYISINKNDDDIYIEVLELDHELGRSRVVDAERIIRSQEAPPKLHRDPSMFECKWCPAHRICHQGDAVDQNCRSCKNARPVDNGEWECAKFGLIPRTFIKTGCESWEPCA